MTLRPHVLVVGASQAGLQLATSLRELGHDGPITLVGEERHAAYQRPPLSKAFLLGNAIEESLFYRNPSWYAERAIDLVTGERVQRVILTAAGAGMATTASGRDIAFDRLALTVGGTPRRLTIPGSDLRGIHYMRDIDDALTLRQEIFDATRAVVIGGGFIGLEAAAVATGLGKHTTVVEAQDRLLARAVAPEVSEFFLRAHQKRGSHVMLGTGVAGFTGTDRVTGVTLSDSTKIPADVVVVGIGLVPQTELAEQIGLECAGGIIIDEACRTSVPTVVAAGDCAVTRLADGTMRRLESVDNAITQAKIAAATLLGLDSPDATTVPWFWSDQADLKLQTAGLNTGYDRVVLRVNPTDESFAALYYRAGQLLSVDAVNAPRDYMAVKKVLETGGNVPVDAAADPTIPLKEFLRASA